MENKYNPNAWNKCPDVTPPTGVLMRVEATNGKKYCAKSATFYGAFCWVTEKGKILPIKAKRFRPWED